MPTPCTIMCFRFCARQIDGVECGLFSIHAPLGQNTLRVRQVPVQCTSSTATPTGSRPCNRPQCKTCPIHHPANTFTSSRTNVTYPITNHAYCKSINLIYQLECTECNAFYLGKTRRSLSDRMNGHRFTITVSNPVAIHTQSHQIPFQKCWSVRVIHKLPDSTPDHIHCAIHTQSHQIPFQKCWSVSVIHKLPDSTPGHIRRQFETAYQLVLQSRHNPGLNIR